RVVAAAGIGVLLMFQFEQLTVDATTDAATPTAVADGAIDGRGDLPAPLRPVDQTLDSVPEAIEAPVGEGDTDDPGPTHRGTIARALGSGMAAWVELLLLRRLLRRRVSGSPSLRQAFGRLVPAALAGSVAAVAASSVTGSLPALVEAAVVLGLTGLAY